MFKIPSSVKNSFYSAVTFFMTIVLLSIWYAALNWGLSTADKVGSGSGLTASSWNRIVDGVLDLDTRISNFSFSGGNIGIGTTNPTTKLDVTGKIKATSFWLDIINVTNSVTQVWWKTVSVSCPANYTVISWGCGTIEYGGYLIKNFPSGNWWQCVSYDTYGTAYSTVVYAICIRTN